MTAIDERTPATAERATLPQHGHSRAEITHMLADIGEDDVRNWEAKLMAGGTYPAGDDVRIHELKRKKLRIKDEIALLQTGPH